MNFKAALAPSMAPFHLCVWGGGAKAGGGRGRRSKWWSRGCYKNSGTQVVLPPNGHTDKLLHYCALWCGVIMCFPTEVHEPGSWSQITGLFQPGTFAAPGHFHVLLSHHVAGTRTFMLNKRIIILGVTNDGSPVQLSCVWFLVAHSWSESVSCPLRI